MPVPTLTTILKRILKQPTAPFHEYHVRAEIEAVLDGCPNVKTKVDKFGNLLVTYKNGKRKSRETWVLGAHMDHPGFVAKPGGKGKDDWEFLGGVPKGEVEAGIKKGLRKAKGGIATWNFPLKISGERIEATACDDLVGCAIILAVIWDLASLDLETTFHAVFTRAEEVGFLGAWQVGKKWPFAEDAVFVSVETSRPVNGAVMGGGPIVRVGDRLSIFDGEAVGALTLTAAEQGIRVQRCLLDAGACEASAMQACGRRSVGVSVPLGNYHNMDDAQQIAPEYVMMDDVKSMVNLLKALVATGRNAIEVRTIEERVALRMSDYAEHLKAGNKGF
jgi:putative aminopeptidase FrvX